MQAITTHLAGPRDIESIARFQVACWREAYRGLIPDSFLDSMDLMARTANWRRRIEQRERAVVVANQGQVIAGVISWTPGVVDELNTLYVAPAFRGSGLAARLLTESIADRPAALWVFSGNTRASRFYEKHDFAPTGASQVDEETGVEELRLVRASRATR